jgi:hypothetical protein
MMSFDLDIHTKSRSMQLFSHDRGGYSSIRNRNVLVYWPHGFGDLVGLGYVLPLLDPSNKLWITRFGDDYLSLMDGSDYISPVFAGGPPAVHSGDGGALNLRHFGLTYDQMNGEKKTVSLPRSVHEVCRRHKISTLLWTSYPETVGRQPFPYHTKARNLARHIAPRSSFPVIESNVPLINGINFNVAPWLAAWVEARLRNVTGFGDRKLCILSRNGYTAINKNWGHCWREDMPPGHQREGEECRDFMRLLLKKDRKWVFLVMEDRLFENDHTLRSRELNCFSFADIFGSVQESTIPFGLILKAILNLASLSIGVPVGPFHLSMAKRDLPTVGIWLGHSPTWYDEPKQCALHLVSSEVARKHPEILLDNTETGCLGHRIVIQPTRIITGAQVLSAVETLLQ